MPNIARVVGLLSCSIALALVAPDAALAQSTGTVRGRVTDAGTTTGISDAQVFVVGTQLGAITNATGDYTIAGVPVGARQLIVRRIGYEAKTSAVTVAAGQTARVDFSLTRAAAQLTQVVVTAFGQQTEARTLGTAVQTVSGQAIAESQR